MKKHKYAIIDPWGLPPEIVHEMVEANSPRAAVKKACNFLGKLTMTKNGRHYQAIMEATKNHIFPKCHRCGEGRCTGHKSKSVVATVLVVDLGAGFKQ